MWKASFDRSLDEVGRDEGNQDCHVDLAGAAAVSRRDALRICSRIRDELIEPAAPAGNRGDEENAALGTYCAGVLRGHGCGNGLSGVLCHDTFSILRLRNRLEPIPFASVSLITN